MATTLKLRNITPLQIFEFSRTRDVVSPNPTNTSSGMASLSFTTEYFEGWKRLKGELVTFTHNDATYYGVVTNVTLTGRRRLSIVTQDYYMAQLNVETTIRPFTGSVRDFVGFIAETADTLISVDAGVPTFQVVSQGFTGSVWTYFRMFLQRYGLNLTTSGSGLTVTNHNTAVDYTQQDAFAELSESADYTQSAKSVEVTYFNNQTVTRGQLYPDRFGVEEPSVISVQAGERAVVELVLNANITHVNQPVGAGFIGPNHNPDGTDGSYAISGSDGLAIDPVEWDKRGGYLRVMLKEGTQDTIIVVLQAPNYPSLPAYNEEGDRFAPYSLALSGYETEFSYPTLFITGDGTRFNPENLSVLTSVTTSIFSSDVGETYENPFVAAPEDAADIAARITPNYTGRNHTISGAFSAGSGHGDVLDKRFRSEGTIYRIESTSESGGAVSFSATSDTTHKDVRDHYAVNDLSYAGVGELLGNYTYSNATSQPLKD